jgi:hypothetical protein
MNSEQRTLSRNEGLQLLGIDEGMRILGFEMLANRERPEDERGGYRR